MEYDFKEILDIGLEIEFSNIKRETPNFINNLHKELSTFKHVHDASTETPEITLGNIPVQFDVQGKTNKILSIMRTRNFEIFGGEINSPVLAGNEFREHIYKLMNFLIDMGESFSTTEQDNRGSIHIHVNVSKDIKHKHLIRLLELGLATEAIFYRLGGMGRVNRGVKNDFIYQRPITMPPCISCNGTFYPIFDYKDLLVSKSKTDFYNKYGDSVNQIQHGNHYVTQRYVGLNFYSIPYRGSIEFRYANKVLIPEWIIAWTILCQSFVNFALTEDKDNEFENVYRKLEDNKDISENEVLFILDRIGVPDDTQITLLDVWHNSSIPEFDGKHIITHLPNPTFFNRDNYLPNPVEYAKRILVEDVRTVNQVKNIKLQSQGNNYPEVDYIIDTSGVKTKLKDINLIYDYRLDNRNDIIIHNWQLAGLDITRDYTQENAINFVQERIYRGKLIPFDVLMLDRNYEFTTMHNWFNIFFCLKDNKRKIEFKFFDTNSGDESRLLIVDSIDSDTFNCKAFNFSEYIEDCHENPENYFDNRQDDEENIFDEELDDNPEEIMQRNIIENNPVVNHPNNVGNAVDNMEQVIRRINNVGNGG